MVRRILAGIWLTACTYPVVVLVLAPLFQDSSRWIYLLVAETFAPVAECLVFWFAFGNLEDVGTVGMWRDFAAIVAANFASFIVGEVLNNYNWFGILA
jgi:hypothetical protein